MQTLESMLIGTQGHQLFRATVLFPGNASSPVIVRGDSEDALEIACEMLQTSRDALTLAAGDAVLVWHSGRDEEPGVIVGRIGPTLAPERSARVEEVGNVATADVPDILVLEAKHSLTLRVGEGSITIREDGKVLIKGKDLVSHAQRMNRIRGGAVSIN